MSTSAVKTAYRHYTQYLKAPIPGVSISILEGDKFHVNTKLLEDLIRTSQSTGSLRSLLTILTRHHSAVWLLATLSIQITTAMYLMLRGFAAMFWPTIPTCTYQSASSYMGWTPSANFTTLMVYLQPFFADPDGRNASEDTINELRKMDENYSCDACGHSTKVPFPPFDDAKPSQDETSGQVEELDPVKLSAPSWAKTSSTIRRFASAIRSISFKDEPIFKLSSSQSFCLLLPTKRHWRLNRKDFQCVRRRATTTHIGSRST
ncbi:hypothetical protein AeNC1_014902 [Aphanomyces euteiches]|nr:hypothetical protein AeNC1_014902 [Aphanomyces euteiches]